MVFRHKSGSDDSAGAPDEPSQQPSSSLASDADPGGTAAKQSAGSSSASPSGDEKDKDKDKPPPVPDEYVAKAPSAAEPGERESWGDRPKLDELRNAARIQVRTRDPKAAPTPVPGGVIATPEGTTTEVSAIEARGALYLAALAACQDVEIRIVE